MREIVSIRFLLLIALVSSPGCDRAPVRPESRENGDPKVRDMKPRGQRLLGCGVTEGSIGYEAAFGHAKSVGIQFVELAQQWDEVEVSPGKFRSPFLKIANAFYAANDTSIVLSINPIDTTALRVPKHLQGKPLDSPEVIRSFIGFVDFVFEALPDLKVIAVSLGNEVDGWLAGDPKSWERYSGFVDAVSEHIRKTRPGIPIGVKATWASIVKDRKRELEALNQRTDAVMVTYYPLNPDFTVRQPSVVGEEIDRLVKIAGGKPVLLLETGYPCGIENASSERQQAEFVEEIFTAWDRHSESLRMVNFVWLCDMSRADVAAMTKYYSVQAPAFASFLSTLGLRTHDGKAREAFLRLESSATSRGWK